MISRDDFQLLIYNIHENKMKDKRLTMHSCWKNKDGPQKIMETFLDFISKCINNNKIQLITYCNTGATLTHVCQIVN